MRWANKAPLASHLGGYEEVQTVDLSKEPDPVSYSKLASTGYHKLRNPHTSSQGDKRLRLPKHNTVASYANGQQPDSSHGRDESSRMEDLSEGFNSDDDLPSLPELMRHTNKLHNAPSISKQQSAAAEKSLPDYPTKPSTVADDGLDEGNLMSQGLPSYSPDHAGTGGEFAAFNAEDEAQFSSPARTSSRKMAYSADTGFKRAPSLDDSTSADGNRGDIDEDDDGLTRSETTTSKRARVEEASSAGCKRSRVESVSFAEGRFFASPGQPEVVGCKRGQTGTETAAAVVGEASAANVVETDETKSVPSWVNDFDIDLIEGLKGIVDFVD